MTAFDDKEAAAVRSPVTLLVMTLDFCGRTFGSAPCLASGIPCFNTYQTCKYKPAYLRQAKEYLFSGNEQPLPFPGPRPYLKGITIRPTEIEDNFTVAGRWTFDFYDEPDGDVGIDPYLSQRSTVYPATYFKKLVARNPNYRTRLIQVLDGYEGLTREEFRPRGTVAIESVKIDPKGTVKVECVDLLKALDDVKVPPQLNLELANDIADDAAMIRLKPSEDSAALDVPGWIRIGDSIIAYTGFDPDLNQFSGCTWQIDGTVAASATAGTAVQKVWHRPQENGFDRVKAMLMADGGYDDTVVRTDVIDYWRDWPGGEIDLPEVFVSEPEELRKLILEVTDLLDCKIWVDEDSMITIRRNMPNAPERVYTFLSDDGNIIKDSIQVDLNPDSRVSEILLCWAPTPLLKIPANVTISPGDAASKQSIDTTAFLRKDFATNPEAAGPNMYNGPSTQIIFCRWLYPGYIQEELLAGFIESYLQRRIVRSRDPQPIITCEVEIKDSGIRTGDYVKLSTGALVNPDGSPWDQVAMQVIRKEPKGNKLQLKLLRVDQRRFFMFAPGEVAEYYAAPAGIDRRTPAGNEIANPYLTATQAEREYGFWSEDHGMMPGTYDQGYAFY